MQPWRVFYSYSHSQPDADLREKLGTYLAPLRHQNKIEEWYDRKIEPGTNWNSEINARLDSAHLILLLLSANFFDSDYCLGIEVEKALTRLKRGEVKVVPILLRPCLWQRSPFSELQVIPRDAKAIRSWTSEDEALADVANEIAGIVSESLPPATVLPPDSCPAQGSESPIDLVRRQIRSYARLYERIRLRMRSSKERTQRMDEIFDRMRKLAVASYPLLNEFAASPSPGERLAAVAILRVFATQEHLPFLVRLVGSDKPFVGYHATKALHFAVKSLDTSAYPELLDAIHDAQAALMTASGSVSGRQTVLGEAEQELRTNNQSLSAPSIQYD